MSISWKSLAVSITILNILAGAACATPDFGPTCSTTGCHTRTAGAVSASSNLLQIPMGTTGGVTPAFSINITSTGNSSSTQPESLSLTKLNAAGLGATADASWTHGTSGGDWWYVDSPYLSGTPPIQKSLNLTVPAGAVRGSYPIDVFLAGAGGTSRWSKQVLGAFTVQVGVPGDYNDNGVVDAADYVLWRKSGPSGPLPFEMASLGTVDAADYTAWRARFGKTTAGAGSGSFANTSIPEPANMGLAVLGLLAIEIVRRRCH